MKSLVFAACAALAMVAMGAPQKADPQFEKDAAEIKALCAKVWECKKTKAWDDAVAAAEKAVALAQKYPDKWLVNQDAYNALGSAYEWKKDYPKCFEAFVTKCKYRNPDFGCDFNGFAAPIEMMRAGKCAEARALLDRVRKIDRISDRSLREAIDVEARTYKVEKRWDDILKLYARVYADTNFCAKVGAMSLFNNEVKAYRESTKGLKALFQLYDDAFAHPEKYCLFTKRDKDGLLGSYTDHVWQSMDMERFKDMKRRVEANGGKLSGMPYHLYHYYFDMLPKFPMSEEDLAIPTDPSKFLGFDVNKKVVHAKDFGWNATNATACLQAALEATNATTVIVDAMPGPWYINSLDVSVAKCSNRRIVFAKGCTILSTPESNDRKAANWYRRSMFEIKATNVWFEGEGQLGKDTYIGKYRNRAERLKAGWEYGGSGFACGGARHCVFKNLWLANNGQDGLCGGFSYSYVIDCLMDDNYRQGVSLGTAVQNVFKNVTFCNTFGGEPHCGVDFEPYYEVHSCPFNYFFDCKFYNNASRNIIFSTSTFAPMCAYFKRCQFEAQRNGNICITTRIGIYLDALCHAPSNITFDECRIDGYSDGWANPIQFKASFLYDVTFKNCVINDKGKFGRDGDHKASPIALTLDRAVWDGYYPYPGIVTFDNTVINGYEGVPVIEVADRNGKYCINSFRGSVIHNGKKVDLSTFDYQPPERKLKESVEPELAKLTPAEGTSANWSPAFAFDFSASWYQQMPQYTMLVSGKQGETAEFKVHFNAISHVGDAIVLTRPDGKTENVCQPKPGDNTFTYKFPADGVYSLNMNIAQDHANPDNPKSGFQVLGVKGAYPAWQAAKVDLGRVFKMRLGDDYPAYTGYFEMPANKVCTIRLQEGGLEIRNAEGKVVKTVTPADYFAPICFTISSKQNEIWSFRTIGKSVYFKFCDPMPGFFADDPAWLPTYGKDLAFTRQKRAGASMAEMPKVRLFALPISGAIAKQVDAEAAKRLAFGATNNVVKAYKKARYHYEWMEPAMQTPEDLAMMDAELASLEPLRKQRDMQVAAKRESADLRRYVAFVSLYAPVLALDDAQAKAWVKNVGKSDDAEALAEATNAAINPYGVEWLDEGLYYESYEGIVKLAPFIADRLKSLGF